MWNADLSGKIPSSFSTPHASFILPEGFESSQVCVAHVRRLTPFSDVLLKRWADMGIDH